MGEDGIGGFERWDGYTVPLQATFPRRERRALARAIRIRLREGTIFKCDVLTSALRNTPCLAVCGPVVPAVIPTGGCRKRPKTQWTRSCKPPPPPTLSIPTKNFLLPQILPMGVSAA